MIRAVRHLAGHSTAGESILLADAHELPAVRALLLGGLPLVKSQLAGPNLGISSAGGAAKGPVDPLREVVGLHSLVRPSARQRTLFYRFFPTKACLDPRALIKMHLAYT